MRVEYSKRREASVTNQKFKDMKIYQITKDEQATNLIYKSKLELIETIIELKQLFPKSKIDFL